MEQFIKTHRFHFKTDIDLISIFDHTQSILKIKTREGFLNFICGTMEPLLDMYDSNPDIEDLNDNVIGLSSDVIIPLRIINFKRLAYLQYRFSARSKGTILRWIIRSFLILFKMELLGILDVFRANVVAMSRYGVKFQTHMFSYGNKYTRILTINKDFSLNNLTGYT